MRIRNLCKEKDTCVKGWAIYWASIYEYVFNSLQKNQELANASIVVRYEDLCNNFHETMNKIINHVKLSQEKFAEILKEYSTKISEPTYYKPNFTDDEIGIIKKYTGKVAKNYGYE